MASFSLRDLSNRKLNRPTLDIYGGLCYCVLQRLCGSDRLLCLLLARRDVAILSAATPSSIFALISQAFLAILKKEPVPKAVLSVVRGSNAADSF